MAHGTRTIALSGLLVVMAAAGAGSLVSSAGARAGKADGRPELGAVDWQRDFEEAKELAAERDKPMFVLFTEVPGCSTVRGYGKRVLSNSVVAQAIEEHFVPVAVFNNEQGEDRRVLKSFGEPTWNNPAVRIIRPDRSALAPRLYGDYSVGATLATIVEALESAEEDVPAWLRLAHRQTSAEGRERRAIFGMYCFWSGEAKLGRLEGVVETRTGFLEGAGEVVEVTYDEARTDLEALAAAAEEVGAASEVFVRQKDQLERARAVYGDAAHHTDAAFRHSPEDEEHALDGTPYEALELFELQSTRVNAAVAAGLDPEPYLTPRQRAKVKE